MSISWSALFFLLATPIEPSVQEGAAATEEVLSFTSRPTAAYFADPRDRGLLEVLQLLGPRLSELPGEFEGLAMPPRAAGLLARLCHGGCSLSIHGSEQQDGFPLSARFALAESDAAAARALAGEVIALLRDMGLDVELAPTGAMSQLPAPLPLFLGQQGEECVITIGSAQGPSAPSSQPALALPADAGGAIPVASFSINYGAFLELILQGMQQSGQGQELAQVRQMLDSMGIGELRFEGAWGFSPERSVSSLRMPGYARSLREMGYLPEGGLPAEALRAVPEDALWASVSAIDLPGYVDWILEILEPQVAAAGIDDPVETLDQMTGFHLYRDLLDHLGSAMGIYQSDTSGGGGILSLVLFVELSKPAAIVESLGRAAETLTGMAAGQAQGYVRARRWAHDTVEYATLTFPGLPVPCEPTLAVAGNWLILGASPQAALGGAHQVLYATRGLADNERFRAQAPGDKQGVTGVSFIDTPRFLRSGYLPASMLCSALANAVRSRVDPGRDPGLVLPPYHELARDARAMVTVGYLRGDDFVQHGFADRSFMVNLVGIAGYLMEGPFLPLFGLAAAGGARIQQEQQAAQWEAMQPVPEPDAHGEDELEGDEDY